MKYCCRCQSNVNVVRETVRICIIDSWHDHCEKCGNFVDAGFESISEGKVFKGGVNKAPTTLSPPPPKPQK